MANKEWNGEVCHAHSGILTWMKLGGSAIGVLLMIFMTILGIMWSELRGQNKEILLELKCLAPSARVSEIEIKQQTFREKQIEIDGRVKALEHRK